MKTFWDHICSFFPETRPATIMTLLNTAAYRLHKSIILLYYYAPPRQLLPLFVQAPSVEPLCWWAQRILQETASLRVPPARNIVAYKYTL